MVSDISYDFSQAFKRASENEEINKSKEELLG
jgi:hypothetical protein